MPKQSRNYSATQLRFVSKLISNGEVTKASLSLSQSIQYRITKTWNITTPGLGVKLHHKFGSSDLIHILNGRGYTASYDEVLQFCKSVESMSVTMLLCCIRWWGSLGQSDSYLLVWQLSVVGVDSKWLPRDPSRAHHRNRISNAPSWDHRDWQHSAGHQYSLNIIPRLTSKQAKSVGNNRAISLMHYTDAKKVMPLAMPTGKTTGISYTEVCAWQASLVTAQEKGTQWLNRLSQGQDAIEWNGFNNQLTRSQSVIKPVSTYMVGPLIDAPPDTILTTLRYTRRSLVDIWGWHMFIFPLTCNCLL